MTSTTIGRAAAVVAVGVAGLWLAGCKNTPPERTTSRRGTPGRRRPGGQRRPGAGETKIIRYPTRYAVPPDLTVKSVDNKCQVLEQREDSFRVVNTQSDRPGSFTWKSSSRPGTTTVIEGPPRSAVLQTGGPPAPPAPYPAR